MQNEVSRVLNRLGGVYRDPSRVNRDVTALLNSTVGCHLKPELSTVNYASTMALCGTVAIKYRGATYNIPIELFLPPNYGPKGPVIYVRPATGMKLKERHPHVGGDGMVYMPYLHAWRPHACNLIDAVTHMVNIFGSQPPVFSDPHYRPSASTATATAQPVSSSQTPSQQQQQPTPPRYEDTERLAQLQREAEEANAAVEAVRRAERAEQQEEQNTSNTRLRLETLCQQTLKTYRVSTQEELSDLFKDQVMLEKTQAYITGTRGDVASGQMEYLSQTKASLEKFHSELDTSIKQLHECIADAEKEQASQKELDVDELALPADVHSAQMLVLSAENAAINDALFFLDKALEKKVIPLEEHLQAVRKLAKRQFLLRAHLLKIGQLVATRSIRR